MTTVALAGPTSPMRAKKMRNAAAVQTTTRMITEVISSGDSRFGRCVSATGEYTNDASTNEAPTTPIAGIWERYLDTTKGLIA